jgi:hypothetical protein
MTNSQQSSEYTAAIEKLRAFSHQRRMALAEEVPKRFHCESPADSPTGRAVTRAP